MQEFNIIGDIAGCYDTMLALIDQMPKTATVISVGDMVDRGPKSKEVVEYFASGKGLAVLGNHEHLFLDAMAHPMMTPPGGRYYGFGVWTANGGGATIMSYNPNTPGTLQEALLELISYVPQTHVDFLKGLPYYRDFGDLIVSHAPINPGIPFEMALDIGDNSMSRRCMSSILWNRGTPRRIPGKFQVHGHNTYNQPAWFWDAAGKWGIDLDTLGRADKLTGMHWPSMEIFQQKRLEP